MQRPVEGAARELLGDEREDLLHARLDDFAQEGARQDAGLAPAHGRHLHRVLLAHQARQGAAVLLLDALGLRDRRAQADGDVVGHVLAAGRQGRDVADGAALEDHQVGRAGTDVDERHAHLLLVGRQDGVGGRELLQDDLLHLHAGAVDAVDQVLGRRDRGGDDVHAGLQLRAGHAGGIVDAVLVVHHELLRQDVDDLALRRDVHGAGRGQDALHVVARHLVIAPGDGDDAAAVQAAHVRAGDADEGAIGRAAGHQLGLLDRLLDRGDAGVEVDHDPLAHAAGRGGAVADDVDRAPALGLGDQDAYLGGADVQSHDVGAGSGHVSLPCFRSPPREGGTQCGP